MKWALIATNTTDQAMKITVPLGFMENEETISDEHYDRLVHLNRLQYCSSLDERLQETERREPPASQGGFDLGDPELL